MSKLLTLLHTNQPLFFDGGTGSVLQSQGLYGGELPELWNLTHPEQIRGLHTAYFQSGCNIIKTNTFGANLLKIEEATLEQVVNAAMQLAKEARDEVEASDSPYASAPHLIALDIGPTGKLLAPLGDLPFEDAVFLFQKTISLAVTTGIPDLILIETMNDLYEAKAAIVAAKECCDLPIFVTTVYDETAKLLTGANPAACIALFEGMGVTALGMNCSLGPAQMRSILPELAAHSSVPIIVNPNAGLPRTIDGATVYDVDALAFSEYMKEMVLAGAKIVGGCCGTTPAHISAMVHACKDLIAPYPEAKQETVISSFTHAVAFQKRPILIGERINPTGKKRFQQALRDHNIDYILQEGLKQQDNGADVLDVNVGLPEIDEPQLMVDVLTSLQSVIDLPLQIDTTDPIAMEKALRCYNGKALINSVNGTEQSMHTVFPLVKKYGGVVVALTLDEDGIPTTCEGRLKIAEKIYAVAESYGIGKHEILIDTLAMSVASDDTAARETLRCVKAVTEQLGGKTILGVSNISFGLPKREFVTSAFFTMAMQAGLSAAIMNPNSLEMQKAYRCFCMLSGLDNQCMDYITFMNTQGAALETSGSPTNPVSSASGGTTTSGNSAASAQDPLYYAIVHGLSEQAVSITTERLQQLDANPMDLINQSLIPALDDVGKRFEAKTLYLPQLLMSAGATGAAFDIIKTHLAASGTEQEKKCKVIIATVQGDIHDIGKNIVKVLLENYAFDVIDLGKDVAPQLIVDTCIAHHAPLVALSALMTTTVPAMAETIALLRQQAPWAKVMVGGAVMTQEYADMIGADSYSKDAMGAVAYAGQVHAELNRSV